jgi:bleomycin hydrolase
MKKITRNILSFSIAFILFFPVTLWSQDKYKFTIEKELAATSVKNQGYTGTCWSFATCSFLESELLRLGKEETDLSEMYIVRCAYIEKAKIYIRLHGTCNFGEGGEAHDVINMMKKYGMVPQKIYEGKKDNEKMYDHSQLEPELKEYLDKLLKENESDFPSDWLKAYEKILDKYLGKVPETFEYDEKKYTPMTFMTDYMGINPDDYIEFTSFNHHPFNTEFFLEIPDNWSFDQYRNITLDEITEIIDSSIAKGYTVGWGGDVSENEFSSAEGIAIIPEKSWEHKSDAEKERTLLVPEKEMDVTQELHQKGFDNFSTTDDHFMHITGIAKDQSGNKYYITKNSWGKKGDKDGYIYLSEEFVKLKVISLIVNKNVVPATILKEFDK